MKKNRNMESRTLKIGFRSHAPGENGLTGRRRLIDQDYSTGTGVTLTTKVHSPTIRSNTSLDRGGPIRRITFLVLTFLSVTSVMSLALPAPQVFQGPDVEPLLQQSRLIAKQLLGEGQT